MVLIYNEIHINDINKAMPCLPNHAFFKHDRLRDVIITLHPHLSIWNHSTSGNTGQLPVQLVINLKYYTVICMSYIYIVTNHNSIGKAGKLCRIEWIYSIISHQLLLTSAEVLTRKFFSNLRDIICRLKTSKQVMTNNETHARYLYMYAM